MYIRGTQQRFSSHNIHWKHFLGYPEYFLMGAINNTIILYGSVTLGQLESVQKYFLLGL